MEQSTENENESDTAFFSMNVGACWSRAEFNPLHTSFRVVGWKFGGVGGKADEKAVLEGRRGKMRVGFCEFGTWGS